MNFEHIFFKFIINFTRAFKKPSIKFFYTPAGLRSQFPIFRWQPILKEPSLYLKPMSKYTYTHTHGHT